MTTTRRIPPFDPELEQILAELAPVSVRMDMIPAVRDTIVTYPDTLLGDRPIVYTERMIPGPAGAPDLTVTIFERPDRKPGGPAVYYIHGGGMIVGNRWFGLAPIIDWVVDLDAVLVSVEYRLAPENPYPAPIEDCHAGLLWLASAQSEIGYDSAKLVLAGASAGGGLAAGLALKVRDEGGPALAAQMLIYPMLDDRNATVSSHQFDFGRWDRGSNDTGWDAYLGERRRTDQAPIYAVPAKAGDLSGLPPTFIDTASAEVFRDEDVAYASQIWADGGICELHVWPGGFHAYDMVAPRAVLTAVMIEARVNWLRRTLG